MTQRTDIQLFEGRQVRYVWDKDQEKYWFSIVDVVAVLTEQADQKTARKYWNKLKQRMKDEGSELVTNCHQLKLPAADFLPPAEEPKALKGGKKKDKK